MLQKSNVFDVDIKYRLSVSYACEYDFIVILNPRVSPAIAELLEAVSCNLLRHNPRLCIFQIVPFIASSGSTFRHEPSDLALVALSGALSLTGKTAASPAGDSWPHPPTNLLNTPMTAMAIASELNMKLLAKQPAGGYALHCMVADWVYLTYFPLTYKNAGLWNAAQSENMLDGGAPYYALYRAKDCRYLAVACIEAKFFQVFVDKLALSEEDKAYLLANHLNIDEYPKMKEVIQSAIRTETAQHWHDVFKATDACVSKVFTAKEAKL